MSIRLSPAKPLAQLRPDRMLARRMQRACANDNASSGDMLHAALRHFARHGLAAAQVALAEAQAAAELGDEQGHVWWQGICKMLDRRLAAGNGGGQKQGKLAVPN